MRKVIINCNYCGERFKKPRHQINKNKNHGFKNYCSKKCKHKAQTKNQNGKDNPNWKGGLLIINCECCGEKFNRAVEHINKNKKRGFKNYCSAKCKAEAFSKRMSGKNNPMFGKQGPLAPAYGKYGKDAPGYIDGRTNKNELERKSKKNRRFIQGILKRDNYTCQICGSKSKDKYLDIAFFRKHKCVGKRVKLEVDHIMPWSQFPKLRYDSKNCRTLCKLCHAEYGADPHRNPAKWAISDIKRFFAKEDDRKSLPKRDYDPNLSQEGKDSLTDMYGNIHIFPIENMHQHIFDPKKSKDEICWCIPEINSQGKCEECNEEHQPFFVFHSWLM